MSVNLEWAVLNHVKVFFDSEIFKNRTGLDDCKTIKTNVPKLNLNELFSKGFFDYKTFGY